MRTGATEIRCPTDIPEVDLAASVFIGGGIGVGKTDVVDWQQLFIHELLCDVDVFAINPRREKFSLDDPNALREQIEWEHKGLSRAHAISFWLPSGYSCPISIYELGAWSVSLKPIFVGIDPDYPNRDSIVAQLEVTRPNLFVVDNLPDLAGQIRRWRFGEFEPALPELRPIGDPAKLYLSGGISDSPDWQAKLSSMIDQTKITVVDPRRRDLDCAVLDSARLRDLARENHRKLLECGATCIWFPEESRSPASLFELGALSAMTEKVLFVGAHRKYFRARDVEIQTGLIGRRVDVLSSLEALAAHVNQL